MNHRKSYADPLKTELLQLGRHVNEMWRGEVSVALKSDSSFITSADTFVHEKLLQLLPQVESLPVLSEEAPFQHIPDECWMVDPIDGTGAFVAGIPTWSISIVRISEGKPFFSCFYFPAFNWFLHSEMTDKILRVRPYKDRVEREDFVTVPSDFHRNYTTDFNGKLRSLGSCSSEVAYAATGESLCAFVGRVKVWDIAPAVPLIQRSGGIVRSVEGIPFSIALMQDSPNSLSSALIAGSPYWVDRFSR
jgi:fructose-1,6-bisphosphatase/inositol monophosphatase family enzyme